MDDRPNRRNETAFSNFSSVVGAFSDASFDCAKIKLSANIMGIRF